MQTAAIYAVQRSAPGHWIVRAPDDDPLLPATVIVAAIDAPAYCGRAIRSTIVVRPFDPDRKPTRGEINNLDWRGELLESAPLLDRLAPDHHDLERFHLQKDALAHELRRLARWGGIRYRASDMTERGDDDSVEITPEMAVELRELCARRETMTDDAFADALSEVLEIPRVMLDQATTITAAGLQGDVEAGRLTFEEAYWLARMKN